MTISRNKYSLKQPIDIVDWTSKEVVRVPPTHNQLACHTNVALRNFLYG